MQPAQSVGGVDATFAIPGSAGIRISDFWHTAQN